MAPGNKLYDLAPGKAGAAKTLDPETKSYMAKEDLRVLRQAEDVRCDPGRMKAVQDHAKGEMEAYARLLGKPGPSKGGPRPKK